MLKGYETTYLQCKDGFNVDVIREMLWFIKAKVGKSIVALKNGNCFQERQRYLAQI